MQFCEKQQKIRENIETLNLSQQKEKGTIQYLKQIIILQSFSQNIN